MYFPITFTALYSCTYGYVLSEIMETSFSWVSNSGFGLRYNANKERISAIYWEAIGI